MDRNRCACGQPVTDGYLCRACTRQLQDALAGIVAIAPELDLAIARQVTFTRGPGRSNGHPAPLPYDPRASQAATSLRDVLAVWIRLADPAGVTDPRTDAMARQILAAVPAVRARGDATRCLDDISRALSHVMRVIDRPPQRVYAGPCPSCCADLLGKPGHTTVTCRGCGNGYDIATLQAKLREQTEDLLGSAAWCASMATALGLPVSEFTVRSWVRRHKLQASHYQPARTPDGEAKPLYRLGKVLDLASEMRRTSDNDHQKVPASEANAPGTRPI